MRATRAEVDLDAVAHNMCALRSLVAPAEVCAVVKADGYGHGAIAVGQAAVEAGASWLGVALVEEGAVLRRSGIDVPILLLSQPRHDDVDAAVALGLHLSAYTADGLDAISAAARRHKAVVPVHLKVNTGMNRVGAAPEEAPDLAHTIVGQPELSFEALWTHCAVADEPGNEFTDAQLDRFDEVTKALAGQGFVPRMRHAANTAAAIDHPRSRFDLVRVGIGTYGLAPSPALQGRVDLRPALELRAEVAMVKRVRAGERISYGLSHRFERDATVATVPIGYADGVTRRLSSSGGEVLIGGVRRPIVGTITMDQLMVDCGDDEVAVGDEVVLIGQQADEVITAQEWADRVDTIAYEVVCGIGPRVPRHYHRSGRPGAAA
jgi:alanine racemase